MTFAIPIWTIYAIAVIWIICGVFSYGFTFAYFQREWPPIAEQGVREDRWFAFMTSFLGPVMLIIEAFAGQMKHGVMFTPDWYVKPFFRPPKKRKK